MKHRTPHFLFPLLLLVAVFLAACSVNVETGGQKPPANADATKQAVEQLVATSVAATKSALETAMVAADTPAPEATPVPPTDTPAPVETPTALPVTVTPKTALPKITVMVPTVDVQITLPAVTIAVPTVVVPVVTIPAITPLPLTPVVTLPPAMRVCDPPAATSFQQILNANPSLSAALGCPTGINPNVTPEAWEVQTAFEPFEHGMMIWSNKIGWYEQPVIYVLYENGAYERFDDTFDENVDPESGGETPPAGLLEPIRGFGKVWRENPGVRSALGWATAPEAGGPGRFQIMENGEIIWLSETGQTYVFRHDNSHWYEFSVPFQE